jgi:hypothetical protein
MLLRLLAVVLLLFAAQPAAAQCCGDCDGNGEVAINELIGAVNVALGGCDGGPNATPTHTVQQPTPTRTPTAAPAVCPYKFNQAVTSNQFCSYDGTGDVAECTDPFGSSAGWVTTDTDVLALLIDEFGDMVAVSAKRTSPTAARVTSLAFGPDFDEVLTATGNIAIPSNTRMTVSADLHRNCGQITFGGDFAEIITNDGARGRARFGGLRRVIDGANQAASEPASPIPAAAREMLQRFARRAVPNAQRGE